MPDVTRKPCYCQIMVRRFLATVQTGGWVTGWVGGLIQLIAILIQEGHVLYTLAVKGGPACDEELVLITYI